MGRKVEGSSALINQHILEVRVGQRVRLFQTAHQTVGPVCSHLVLQRLGVVVTVAGIHIFYPYLQELPLTAGIVGMAVEQLLTESIEVLPQLFAPLRKGLFCGTLRNHILMEMRVHQFLIL